MNKPKKKPLRYFFYKGDLCKKIHINRGSDIITAWNYPKRKLEPYVYSDVKKNGEPAYGTVQVLNMLNRKDRRIISVSIANGDINEPQRTYGLDEKQNGYAYYWSEKEILDFHAFLSTQHQGRPRKDGRVNPGNLPTKSELQAMLRQGTVFYVKVGDEFVPTWDAEKF